MSLPSSTLFIKRDIGNIACPSCGLYKTIRRSHARSNREKIVNILTFQKLYRCKSCGWRGHKFNIVFTKQSLKYLVFYIILAVLSFAITKIFLNKIIE